MIRKIYLRLLLVAWPGVLIAQDPAHQHAASPKPSADSVPLYDNLGKHHYTISSKVPRAQQYFDQGLRLYYAFNHAEAIRAFNEAARLDPNCAICHWGTAVAYGPNINAPMDSAAGVQAYAALQRAKQHETHASPKERALIRALTPRYAAVPPAERAALDSAYARAIGEVLRAHPDDPDIAALYAEALMDLSPWVYWTEAGEPRPDTRKLLPELERVIARTPNHPGACHFYIHAVEQFHPERAVPCAERLAGLMPGAGHLVHMPAHIYIRVGRYADAIKANEHAVHADESYIQDQRPGMGTYTMGYYPHNYDFLAFAAMMAGRSQQAIGAARKVESLIPEEMLRAPDMGFLQHYWTGPLRLLVRFGHWDEILKASAPPEDLPYARAMWHYAHGVAQAAKGNPDAAEKDLVQIRTAAENPALARMTVGFNPAPSILQIASNVLAGEIAAQRGNHQEAITHLKEAAQQEDALTYGEPPDWPVPVRHNLGAVLLKAKRPAEAEAAYREDLKRFPENGWALHGLAKSLQAQGKTAEAQTVQARLTKAWEGADVRLTGSRL
jgi:tetratricopeptide (TPR) repeat protein